MEIVTRYREGAYLVIEDGGLAERYISMADDLEDGMVVRVTHNFETFLVCEPATITDPATVERFPPSGTDYAGDERADSETTKCR